jgi:hypothetical protein
MAHLINTLANLSNQVIDETREEFIEGVKHYLRFQTSMLKIGTKVRKVVMEEKAKVKESFEKTQAWLLSEVSEEAAEYGKAMMESMESMEMEKPKNKTEEKTSSHTSHEDEILKAKNAAAEAKRAKHREAARRYYYERKARRLHEQQKYGKSFK